MGLRQVFLVEIKETSDTFESPRFQKVINPRLINCVSIGRDVAQSSLQAAPA